MMLSLVWPIASLGFLLSMTQESFTAANRIAEIFDAPLEIVDGPDDEAPSGGTARTRRRRVPLPRRRTVAAGSRTDWALRHVTATVEPGETLALVGSTGSGKSVLASLLSRLYDVTEGSIRIDGPTSVSCRCPRCARRWPPRSRTRRCSRCRSPRTCGWAPGCDATSRWPRPSRSPPRSSSTTCRSGLDTRIGEQGMSLSGGQRQRLSLARAILAAPKILVLDDTLSALDVHTEAVVEEALRRVLHSVTGIVVAHRASTVLLADKVALLRGRHHHPHRHARRTARHRPAVPLPAGRRRRTRRRLPSVPAPGRTTRTAAGSARPTRSRKRWNRERAERRFVTSEAEGR